MGCDIHAHVEYYDTRCGQVEFNRAVCHSANIFMGRNYTLFNLLAGVRGIGGPLFDTRGIPDRPCLSFDVENKYYLTVVDDLPKVPGTNNFSYENYVLREEAERLVASGSSTFHVDNHKISNPNWHTPSFLFMKELIEIRRHYLIQMIEYETTEYKGRKRKDVLNTIKNSDEYELMRVVFPSIECVGLNATIATMIAIENTGDNHSRFVFWFDS